MTLTKEQLQFIDTYLENSDIVYIDVRREMVDTVATSIEQQMTIETDFYVAFKSYMVKHKKDLQDSNSKLKLLLDRQLLMKLAKKLITIKLLFSMLIAFFISLSVATTTLFQNYSFYIPIGIIAVFLVSNIGLLKKIPKRVSAIERMAGLMFLFVQTVSVFYQTVGISLSNSNIELYCLLLSLLVGILISFMSVISNLIEKYKRQYKIIAA